LSDVGLAFVGSAAFVKAYVRIRVSGLCRVVNVLAQMLLGADQGCVSLFTLLVNKSVTYSTRLETRTKESNLYASCRVLNLKAQ
jgi:hypothetical protein